MVVPNPIESESSEIKYYEYRNPENDREFLLAEVNPLACTVRLTATLGLVDPTRKFMKDLNEEGILPNEETVKTTIEGVEMAIFIANRAYNWNNVWPDLKTGLEQTLNIHIFEQEPPKTEPVQQ